MIAHWERAGDVQSSEHSERTVSTRETKVMIDRRRLIMAMLEEPPSAHGVTEESSRSRKVKDIKKSIEGSRISITETSRQSYRGRFQLIPD